MSDSMANHFTKGTEEVNVRGLIERIKNEFHKQPFRNIAGVVMDRIDQFVNPKAFKGILQFRAVEG